MTLALSLGIVAAVFSAVGCSTTAPTEPRMFADLRGRFTNDDGRSTLEIFGESYRLCGQWNNRSTILPCSAGKIRPIAFDARGQVVDFTCLPNRMHGSWGYPNLKLINGDPRRIERSTSSSISGYQLLGTYTETTTELWRWQYRHNK